MSLRNETALRACLVGQVRADHEDLGGLFAQRDLVGQARVQHRVAVGLGLEVGVAVLRLYPLDAHARVQAAALVDEARPQPERRDARQWVAGVAIPRAHVVRLELEVDRIRIPVEQVEGDLAFSAHEGRGYVQVLEDLETRSRRVVRPASSSETKSSK